MKKKVRENNYHDIESRGKKYINNGQIKRETIAVSILMRGLAWLHQREWSLGTRTCSLVYGFSVLTVFSGQDPEELVLLFRMCLV